MGLDPRRQLAAVWATAAILAAPVGPALAAASVIPPATPVLHVYSGRWLGRPVRLVHVRNVTVEGLADASLAGQLTSFRTNDPAYTCLNGESINVFTAPTEFPGDYVVHNGGQGTQCTYGTWTFLQHPIPTAPAMTVLTIGSPTAHTGATTWTAPAAPLVRGGQPYVPLAALARALRLRVRAHGHAVWLDHGPFTTLLTLGPPGLFAAAASPRTSGGVSLSVRPVVLHRVLLLPALTVAHALGATVIWNRSAGTLSLGYASLRQSAAATSAAPVTITKTFTYGFAGSPLSAEQGLSYPVTSTSTWIGCYGWCGQAKGGLVDSADQPGTGFVGVGTAALGFASATTQQGMGVDFSPVATDGSALPAGLPVALHVQAEVIPVSLTLGISGAGVSCAPTSITWSGPGGSGSSDTLASCLGSLAVSIPIPGAADDTALDSVLETFAENVTENFGPWCVENADQCAQEGQLLTANSTTLAQAMGSWLQVVQYLGPLVGVDLKFYHPQNFTWDGVVQAGQAQDFTVTPQATAQDEGAGVLTNTPYFYTLITVTEQYSENQYAYTFPTAEVGQPLIANSLEQCQTGGYCLPVHASSVSVTSGSLPSGMTATAQGGWAVIAGQPAAGTEGTYTFDLQVDGADIYHCTLSVAPPLTLSTSTPSIVWERGATPRPGFNALPIQVGGGVGPYAWQIQPTSASDFGQMYAAYGPGGGAPLIEITPYLPPGTYGFTATVYDGYTGATSSPLSIQVLPPLALDTTSLPSAQAYTPYSVALVATGYPPYAWHVVSGSLPPGVQLARTGVLLGTPTAAAAGQTYTFVAGVSDGAGGSAQRSLTIAVAGHSTPTVSVVPHYADVGWVYRCIDTPTHGRVCEWVNFGNSTSVAAATTGLPAGAAVSFSVSPSNGVTLAPGGCTTDATYRCSVTLRIVSPPNTRTAYTVTATASGARNTAQVVYGAKAG